MSGDYCSSLYYAVLGGHVDICRMLMERGAVQSINETDWNGMAPLHNAAQLGHMYVSHLNFISAKLGLNG